MLECQLHGFAEASSLPDETPIVDLVLSVRATNCLINAGIRTIGAVRTAPDSALLRIEGSGRRTVAEIRQFAPFMPGKVILEQPKQEPTKSSLSPSEAMRIRCELIAHAEADRWPDSVKKRAGRDAAKAIAAAIALLSEDLLQSQLVEARSSFDTKSS